MKNLLLSISLFLSVNAFAHDQVQTETWSESYARYKSQAMNRASEYKDHAMNSVSEYKNHAMNSVSEYKNHAMNSVSEYKNHSMNSVSEYKNHAMNRASDLKDQTVANAAVFYKNSLVFMREHQTEIIAVAALVALEVVLYQIDGLKADLEEANAKIADMTKDMADQARQVEILAKKKVDLIHNNSILQRQVDVFAAKEVKTLTEQAVKEYFVNVVGARNWEKWTQGKN